ncbi:hypothetical protein ACFPOI_27595 [Nonomuraea angiospora]|uniref:Uncharacterized protein (DUF983 family) n=1 Tax=Nonomuraea angiospora TaxID=46172 RepID=A0ABR9LP27_9ACTN|nr:hypothetical protein [Nonomuraea angiospora]MBE1582027.1 uncharacterized protein (DUF983 family) [Nonomuraea angiospora]
MDPSGSDGSGSGQDLARVARLLAQIVTPTTLIASVLMYFGSVRLNSLYWVLGVNSSMLSFTFQEYVLRSVHVADEPVLLSLLVLLVLILVAPFANDVLIRFTTWHRTATWWTGSALLALGAVSIMAFLVAMCHWLGKSWELPLWAQSILLDLGAALLFYSFYVFKMARTGPVVSTGQVVQRTVLVVLVLLSLLWIVDDRARRAGEADAKDMKEHPEQRLVAVVVYAPQRLNLEDPGIREIPLTDPNAEFRYKYTGLRLLIESSGQYFVVSVCWPTTAGTRAIALPADGSIRLETLSDGKKRSCPKGQ